MIIESYERKNSIGRVLSEIKVFHNSQLMYQVEGFSIEKDFDFQGEYENLIRAREIFKEKLLEIF